VTKTSPQTVSMQLPRATLRDAQGAVADEAASEKRTSRWAKLRAIGMGGAAARLVSLGPAALSAPCEGGFTVDDGLARRSWCMCQGRSPCTPVMELLFV
jgi:hypothetical protein